MEAANLSPSGAVLPLAATINGNNPVDEKTGDAVRRWNKSQR